MGKNVLLDAQARRQAVSPSADPKRAISANRQLRERGDPKALRLPRGLEELHPFLHRLDLRSSVNSTFLTNI